MEGGRNGDVASVKYTTVTKMKLASEKAQKKEKTNKC